MTNFFFMAKKKPVCWCYRVVYQLMWHAKLSCLRFGVRCFMPNKAFQVLCGCCYNMVWLLTWHAKHVWLWMGCNVVFWMHALYGFVYFSPIFSWGVQMALHVQKHSLLLLLCLMLLFVKSLTVIFQTLNVLVLKMSLVKYFKVSNWFLGCWTLCCGSVPVLPRGWPSRLPLHPSLTHPYHHHHHHHKFLCQYHAQPLPLYNFEA